MRNNKQSITVNVIVGYLLIATLAAFAVWFVYSQVISYTSMAEENFSSNNKLFLVGEAATSLYEAESLSRQLIQTGDTVEFDLYEAQIDTIRITLTTLKDTYKDAILQKEIDSINSLLTQKTSNLKELLQLRSQGENQSYYAKVLAELERVDETFEEQNYEQRFAGLEPHQRRVLVKLLEYSKVDNVTQVSSQTVDSLVNAVKKVLIDFEMADRRYRQTLRDKENELLANEVDLNSQLRSLLSTIEAEERQESILQVAESQEMVKKTSQIIAILGAASLLVIFIFLFLVVKDVSKSQKYRKELEDAKQYAETLLKSREQLMATVTHDLRSPLNTVVGYTNLLEKTSLNNSQNHYLYHLKKSSDYILRLVNDLLDLSKLEAGKMTVEKLAFNPKNLIEDIVENTIPVEKTKEVSVKTIVSKELDRPVITDPFRIKQILTNLVTNACKFTKEGSIIIEASLERENRNKYLIIQVKDTGIGISENKKEQIFEEFSQENTSIEKLYGGSGLGLAITKKLTLLLQGSIDLVSETGKGSEFTVRIPVKLTKNLPAESPSKKNAPRKKAASISVLIVDDEPAQLSLLKELIIAKGMECEISNNGEEAMEKLKINNFDLVLTDIQMSKMDGFELLNFIKKDPETKEIPVIALSGKTDMSPPEYIEKGFNGSLLKPYSSGELLEIIEGVLEIEFSSKPIARFENGDPEDFSLKEINLFAAGDKKALDTILKAFIKSTANNLTAFKQAIKENDIKMIQETSHKMLPMFRQIKATSIVEKLAFLETANISEVRALDFETLTTDIRGLMKELEDKITS